MKAAAVGPILLLRVDDKPFTLPAAGRKGPNRCIENPFASLVLPSIRKFFFAAIGSYDRSDNDRLAAKETFLIDTE
jgi:hypothetical protein